MLLYFEDGYLVDYDEELVIIFFRFVYGEISDKDIVFFYVEGNK